MAEGRYLEVKKEYPATLDELIHKYSENFRQQASFGNAKKAYLENFREHFGGMRFYPTSGMFIWRPTVAPCSRG